MASTDLTPNDTDRAHSNSPEVEFALVLSRMIDDVNGDPEHLRQAIYDLARYKLQEQFTYDDAGNIKKAQAALETAIREVEAFAIKHVRVQASPQLTSNEATWISDRDLGSRSLPLQPLRIEQVTDAAGARPKRRPLAYLAGGAMTILVLLGLLIVIQPRDQVSFPIDKQAKFEEQAASSELPKPALPKPAQVIPSPIPPPDAPTPSPLLPTDYGVYAVSNDTLFELHLLPGRAPDIRTAISPVINIPSQTLLPSGHPKFIVFRRDAAGNISSQADIRIVAKVAREFKVGADNKKNGDSDESWVIRNISFPFRSSPIKDNPEMYEIHSENPKAELTPGRYALILKGTAYDFSVTGNIVDTRQCLERTTASNGTFYSECNKP
jgi:hypothetical protein